MAWYRSLALWCPVVICVSLTGSPVAAATVQQDFNAAQALLDAEKWPEARIAFDTLLARMANTRPGRSAAIVKARLAETLLATGETPKAIPLLIEALAAFNPKSPPDREEYTMSMMALGRAYAAQLEFEPAADRKSVV